MIDLGKIQEARKLVEDLSDRMVGTLAVPGSEQFKRTFFAHHLRRVAELLKDATLDTGGTFIEVAKID